MEGIEKDMEDYMAQTFQIEIGSSVNILDILNTMIAPNADETLAANAVRENVFACQDILETSSQVDQNSAFESRPNTSFNISTKPQNLPKSDHCLLTDSLNKLTDMTLAFEGDNFLMLLDFEVW